MLWQRHDADKSVPVTALKLFQLSRGLQASTVAIPMPQAMDSRRQKLINKNIANFKCLSSMMQRLRPQMQVWRAERRDTQLLVPPGRQQGRVLEPASSLHWGPQAGG